jgi:probable phosphomutase (TIGR03848 family)
MMTLLLIRHAEAALDAGVIAGRTPGLHLSSTGYSQAERLAAKLAKAPIAAIYSSPIERAAETSACIAERAGLQFKLAEGLTELDYGMWTGRSFEELREDRRWLEFNTRRSLARIPGGESMMEVMHRATSEVERLRVTHPDQLIAAVSHSDVIRTLLAYFLGVSMDLALRIEINLASVSAVRFGPDQPRILLVNGTGDEAFERA